MSVSAPPKSATLSYLQQHNLQKILESVVNKVVKEKPRDPFAFMAAEFAALSLPPQSQVIFVVGGPAAGKTTLSGRLSSELGWVSISVDELLREERMKGNEVSAQIEAYVKEGKIIPAELVVGLIKNALEKNASGGQPKQFLVEGFPRSSSGIDSWRKACGSNYEVVCSLLLEAQEVALELRSGGDPEARRKVKQWNAESVPLIDALKTLAPIRSIDANAGADNVLAVAKKILSAVPKPAAKKGAAPAAAAAAPAAASVVAASTSRTATAAAAAPAQVAAAQPVSSAVAANGVKKPHVVFVLGGPGSGKGTQCQRLSREYKLCHLQAGELLRDERMKGNATSAEIEKHIAAGQPVPIEITVGLLKAAMQQASQQKGVERFLIDGFPRNQGNLDGWNRLMGDSCVLDFVLFLDASEAVMESRGLKRGENAEAIKKKFLAYVQTTLPIISHFEKMGKTFTINAGEAEDGVYNDIKKVMQINNFL